MATQTMESNIECIREIELSSNIALDVVNDLLTCDKIQSRSLVLDTMYQSPKEFVSQCIGPMQVQVSHMSFYISRKR